jgi:spore photoproduct lyase
VKSCPGTPEYVCCGLEIVHIGQGCPMDCRYCALQGYFNRPVLEVFVNTDDLLTQVQEHVTSDPNRFHRMCTGEFTDSLALDPLTGLAKRLVKQFSGFTNATIELKTKTDFIEPLLDIDPRGRAVLSFSLNAAPVTRREEIRSTSLKQRLSAAVRAQDRGYRLGFHFDPIIPIDGWERHYAETIDALYGSVKERSIAWISLGVLRFVPALKDVIRDRFGPVRYFADGFVPGLDGKSRLPVDRRIAILKRIADLIRRHDPDAPLYLCMESPLVWREALGLTMENDEELGAYLDDRQRVAECTPQRP